MLAYQAAYEGVGENSRQLPKPEEAGKGGPVPERGGTMELEGGNPITAPARGEGTTLRGWGWGGSLGNGRSGGGGEVREGRGLRRLRLVARHLSTQLWTLSQEDGGYGILAK
jgi:hypothetical protein